MSSLPSQGTIKDPSEAYAVFKELIDNDLDLNRNVLGKDFAFIHKAVAQYSLESVKLLLDNGADVNALTTGESKASPLLWAIYVGRIDVCTLLLEYGADINRRDPFGQSFLTVAVLEESAALVELLLEWSLDINIRDAFGFTLLHQAVTRDVITGNEQMERVSDFCSPERIGIIRLLIERGIDIHAKFGLGETALHTAAIQPCIEPLCVLLDAGLDPDVMDDFYRTPLFLAVQYNRVENSRLLLDHTKQINNPVYNGPTCLSRAALNGQKECVDILLRAGAEIYSQVPGPRFLPPGRRLMGYAFDALHNAVQGRDDDIIRMILKAGAVRQPENVSQGAFADWLEVYDRAIPRELNSFFDCVRDRVADFETPELDSLRHEMVLKPYLREDKNRRYFAEAAGLQYQRPRHLAEKIEKYSSPSSMMDILGRLADAEDADDEKEGEDDEETEKMQG